MPHCIIEHSSSIQAEKLISLAYEGMLVSQLFKPDGQDIKVRTQSFDSFRVGTGDADFIHVTIKLLSGREMDQKQALSESVLVKLLSLALNNCSTTVEIVDIERDSYAKHLT